MSSESVYRAIAHPYRRRVLELLRNGERPAGALLGDRRMTKPNLSEHLRVLRAVGLVSARRRGNSIIYRLNSAALRTPTAWLSQFAESAAAKQQRRKP